MWESCSRVWVMMGNGAQAHGGLVLTSLYFAKSVFSEIRRCSPPLSLHLRHHLVQQRGVLLTLAADGGRGHVLVGGYAAVPQGVR